jgi:hypothetical protein
MTSDFAFSFGDTKLALFATRLPFIHAFQGAFYFAFCPLCEIVISTLAADYGSSTPHFQGSGSRPSMPRMKILNSVEREAFDAPPIFNSAERKRRFDFPAPLQEIATSLRTATNQVVFLLSCGYFKAPKDSTPCRPSINATLRTFPIGSPRPRRRLIWPTTRGKPWRAIKRRSWSSTGFAPSSPTAAPFSPLRLRCPCLTNG